MSKFLNIQCQISRIRYPQFAKKWINIRKSYGNFYKVCQFDTSVVLDTTVELFFFHNHSAHYLLVKKKLVI